MLRSIWRPYCIYLWKGEVLLTQTLVYSQSFQASICGFTHETCSTSWDALALINNNNEENLVLKHNFCKYIFLIFGLNSIPGLKIKFESHWIRTQVEAWVILNTLLPFQLSNRQSTLLSTIMNILVPVCTVDLSLLQGAVINLRGSVGLGRSE